MATNSKHSAKELRRHKDNKNRKTIKGKYRIGKVCQDRWSKVKNPKSAYGVEHNFHWQRSNARRKVKISSNSKQNNNKFNNKKFKTSLFF